MILEKILAGELPQRTPGIDDTVWEFLQKCWSRDPAKRPSTAEAYDAFSQFRLLPKFTPTPEGLSVTELPERVKLQVRSIKVSFDKSKQQQFFVKLTYGNKDYTTSPTKAMDALRKHMWFVIRPFLLSLPSPSLTQECSRKLVI